MDGRALRCAIHQIGSGRPKKKGVKRNSDQEPDHDFRPVVLIVIGVMLLLWAH
jgi:hypothetical protein